MAVRIADCVKTSEVQDLEAVLEKFRQIAGIWVIPKVETKASLLRISRSGWCPLNGDPKLAPR